MSGRDYRCECGHAMISQHGPTGCMANGCRCSIQSLRESDEVQAQRDMAKAARDQMQAFIDAGFTEDQAYGLTKELLLLGGRGA